MLIRSPFSNVRILLSSSRVFIDSIQRVSTGPSNMTHFKSGVSSAQMSRIMRANTPSTHSPVSWQGPKISIMSKSSKYFLELHNVHKKPLKCKVTTYPPWKLSGAGLGNNADYRVSHGVAHSKRVWPNTNYLPSTVFMVVCLHACLDLGDELFYLEALHTSTEWAGAYRRLKLLLRMDSRKEWFCDYLTSAPINFIVW